MKSKVKAIRSIFFFLLPFQWTLSGCYRGEWLTIATTTSLYDSGLLDRLVPPFEKMESIRIKVIPVGSGQAMRLGRDGNTDLILSHSPEEEEIFMKRGYGRKRVTFMKGWFILVSPEGAGLEEVKGRPVVEIFKNIAEKGWNFVSRGDSSGTHMKEMEIWRMAGVSPEGRWYIVSGSSMATSFRIAVEKRAILLIDLATFAKLRRDGGDYTILTDQERLLENPYSVIIPSKVSNPDSVGKAEAFLRYIVDGEGRRVIQGFEIEGIYPFTPI